MKKTQGFTLIEILVSFAVLVLIVMVSSNLFFALLRGSTKTKTMQIIKQNGEHAVSVMARMIRNARSISYVTSPTYSVSIINPDGFMTTFSCEDIDGDSKNEISSRSASLVARLVSSDVKIDSCSNLFNVTDGTPGISPAVVGIEFDLKQAAMTDRPEEQALVKFKTTVSLRNY